MIRMPGGLSLRRGLEGYRVMKADGSMLCDGMGSREVGEFVGLLKEAEARGQREMRERCVLLCENNAGNAGADAISLAIGIRALPVVVELP